MTFSATPIGEFINRNKAAELLRDRGIAQVSSTLDAQQWQTQARAFALYYASKNGEVTSDDVQRDCPPPHSVNPNVVGALFRSLVAKKELEFVETRKSGRALGHARRIGVYRISDGG